MALFYHNMCILIFVTRQCSSFSVKFAHQRVDSVESRLEAITKLRRADLVEIFGKLFAIDNKLNMLNLTRDKSYKEETMDVENKEESRQLADYLIKGAASEKLENIKTRVVLTDTVEYLAANNTYTLMLLQNRTKSEVQELKKEMEKLVNEELLNITLANMTSKFSSKRREQELFMMISSLAAEVAAYERSIKTLENHMTSELASEIKALKSNLQIRKEKEEVLMNEIDSLKAKLNERLLKVCSSCFDLMCVNPLKSGVYVVKNNVQVYCDQTTDGGGWTVFQRRKDGSVDFERNWTDYKAGFGDLEGEFWLGNDNIHKLTATGNHELRVDMADFEGNKAYAKYSNFRIKSESDNYAIEVNGYSGDSGDSLTYHNGKAFSTKDRDNDERSGSCSKSYRGAWWYGKGCHYSNLNGFYYNGANSPHGKGIVWYHWKNTHTYSLKYVEMKFR